MARVGFRDIVYKIDADPCSRTAQVALRYRRELMRLDVVIVIDSA